MNNKLSVFILLFCFLFRFSAQASELIHISTAENDTNAIAKLIANGVDINRAENSRGCAALHWAACFNRQEAAKYLIENGANVNARNNMGLTPLHYAALCGHHAMAELLLKNKAQVNSFDCQGLTPLHLAAQNGHGEIIELLLEYEADVAAKTNYRGLTPLHWAAFWGHTEAVDTLLKNGADINGRDHNGNTPLTWAEQSNQYTMARLLARKGGKRHQDSDVRFSSSFSQLIGIRPP